MFFILLYLYYDPVEVCFLMKSRKGVDPDGGEAGRSWEQWRERSYNQDILGEFLKKSIFN